MANWIRDGETVNCTYFGIPVTGIIVESRVKYGGKVQYTVVLDSPVILPWRTDPMTRVLICQDEFLK